MEQVRLKEMESEDLQLRAFSHRIHSSLEISRFRGEKTHVTHYQVPMIETYELVEAAPILASLAIIEVLLSLDRLLEVSEGVSHLPQRQRGIAIQVGGVLADVARIGGLLLAAPIISHFLWAKVLGALYLIHIMSSHFAGKPEPDAAHDSQHWSTSKAIFQVAILDLSLSIGNIVAALALTRTVWIVMLSVVFWMVLTRVFGRPLVHLVKRFPILTNNVPLLTGSIGFLLLIEMLSPTLGLPTASPEVKLLGLVCIVLLSAFYDLVTPLQKIVDPLFASIGMPLMRALNAVLSVLFWPIRAILGNLVAK